METKRAQKLNTKGCCFLCLEDETVQQKDINGVKVNRSISIRHLLQHLQIKSLNDQLLNKNDLKVELCDPCRKNISGITNMLEELEKVQMKINYFLEKISESVSGPGKDSRRVRVYSKTMKDDPTALAQLDFVDNLRTELAVKSLLKGVGPIPCINLRRSEELPEIKKEVDWTEDNCDLEGEDFNYEEANIDGSATSGLLPSPSLDICSETFIKVELNSDVAVDSRNSSATKVKKKPLKRKAPVANKKRKNVSGFVCVVCNKNYTNLKRHNDVAHSDKVFSCGFCKKTFKRTDFVQRHEKICIWNDNKPETNSLNKFSLSSEPSSSSSPEIKFNPEMII